MSTAARTDLMDRETRNAFNELVLMQALSTMPVGGLLRVLKTIPPAVLKAAALEAAAADQRHDDRNRLGSID